MEEPQDRSRRWLLKASSTLGLAVAFGRATIGEAFADLQSNTAQNENAMTTNQCYTVGRQDGYSSVSCECSGSGTYRIAQAHQLDKVA